VINLCATQSYAWIVDVIGREAANVYLSAFGVQFWLQQTDPETCRRAAEICGTVTRERVGADHNVDLAGIVGAIGSGKELVVRRRVSEEERERFRHEDFAHLNVGDIIAYNKGREGKAAKVVKGRAKYVFCTRSPDGIAAVRARVREYYRELLENLTQERGECGRWDCAPEPELPEGRRGRVAVAEMPAADPLRKSEEPPDGLDAWIERLTGVAVGKLDLATIQARASAERSAEPGALRIVLGVGPGGMGALAPGSELLRLLPEEPGTGPAGSE
jgi:hypothetical protein